jgi:hypothetical protein
MSNANIAEVRRLRESGMTLRAIGQRFGVSESYIARFIPKTGRADRSTGVEPGEQARARAAEIRVARKIGGKWVDSRPVVRIVNIKPPRKP